MQDGTGACECGRRTGCFSQGRSEIFGSGQRQGQILGWLFVRVAREDWIED